MEEFKKIKECVKENGSNFLLRISEQENISKMTSRQVRILIREGVLDFFRGERSSDKMFEAFDLIVDEIGFNINRAYYLTNLFAYLFNWVEVQGYESNLHKCLIPINKTEKTKISSVKDIYNYFGLTRQETELALDFKNCDTRELKSLSMLFKDFNNLEALIILNLNMSTVYDMSGMFYGCNNLKYLNVKEWDTSHVINMNCMFASCGKLRDLKLKDWNVSNVKNMKGMFYGCKELKELDVANWNVNNVTNIDFMFYSCENLQKLDLNNWDISNVISMDKMTYGCRKINPDNLFKHDTNIIEQNVTSKEMILQQEEKIQESQEDENNGELNLWFSFLRKLSSEQMSIIKKIVEGSNDIYKEVSDIARQLHSMPEIIVEEINQIAEEILGDYFIEIIGMDVKIYSEYEEEIRKCVVSI